MTHTVKDESELPTPENTRRTYDYFVRSKSDPRFLMNGFDGNVYVRADGRPWMHPAIERQFRFGKWDEFVARGAWYDDATYPYDKPLKAAA